MPDWRDISSTEIMTYEETIDFLFNKTLVFQHVGTPAYKPGLETTAAINAVFGNPDRSFKSIHIAGTNGKGSTAHLIAAILQNSGYKVGLYTSPHLLDFRERIRVDGKMIEREYVADFVGRFLSSGYKGRQASFFELTTIMAFDYFRHCGVDYAVLETGLGGRLDSTNIVSPILSVITNISLDHTQFLGDTLAKIAAEKAGIIKSGIPVVVGETTAETRPVFDAKAKEENAPIRFAEEHNEIISSDLTGGKLRLTTKNFGIIDGELTGDCQIKNANTVLNAVTMLKSLGIGITDNAVTESFAHVCEQTGLMGRWMKIAEKPLTVCDTGHNTGGMAYITGQLKRAKCRILRIVIGFVSDKDIDHILDMMPSDAVYYFTQPSIPRALPKEQLSQKAASKGLHGAAYPTVEEAYRAALRDSAPDDMLYVGGSTFIVADLLATLPQYNI